jgi:AAA domain-containing protein/IclR-like helix-turn-helix domain-containing protein
VPRELLERLAAMVPEAPRPAGDRQNGYREFDLERWISERGLPVVVTGSWNGGTKWVLSPCPWNPDHTNRAAYIVRFPSGAIAAGCHHNGCAGKDWHELRDAFEPGWRDRRQAASWPGVDFGASGSGSAALPVAAPTKPVATITAAELLTKRLPALRSAAPGILPEGLGILAGRPKIGKSWLGLDFAVAVAGGGKVLGKISAEQGDVLYLALEDGERRLQSRLGALVDAAPAGLEFATAWSRLDEGGLELLDRWLGSHPNARLVMIDTLKRVRPRGRRDAGLYDQDYEALGPLADLAKKHGVCILVIHHTRKAGADDPLELVSGSFGLSGAVDSVLVLKRDRGRADAVLAIVDRDQGDQELALEWDAGTFTWTLLGDAEDYRRSKERADIIELLRRASSPMQPKAIAEQLGRPRGAVRFLLHKMAASGEVRKGDDGYTVHPANTANSLNGRAESGVSPDRSPAAGLLAPVSAPNGTANRPDQEAAGALLAPLAVLPQPVRPVWRCVCTALEREYRPQWGDYVCAGCGVTAPAPVGGVA